MLNERAYAHAGCKSSSKGGNPLITDDDAVQ